MDEEASKKITAIFLILAIILAVCMVFFSLKNKGAFSSKQKVGNAIESAEVRLVVVAPSNIGGPGSNLSIGVK